jgi:MoaA/NifB/PqqE/SkfB family radical SAM enzyme
MMEPDTFYNLVHQVKECGISWVGLCGNGEPTLHPKFSDYVRQLAAVTNFLSLTTNWQRVDEQIVYNVLKAPVRLLNISVDGGNKEDYESMRIGGSFERLLQNLTLLNKLKKEMGAPTLVNIRLMLGTAQSKDEHQLLKFWRSHGDVVSKQYILNFDQGPSGSYGYDTESRARCTLPFKILDVNWNGNVPLCTYSRRQTGNPDGLVIGNINHSTLSQIWNGQIIKQYRDGHRFRKEELIPICQGCKGRT